VDAAAVVAEACRVLRPGGRLVIDTLADTRLARLLAVTIGERVPGGAPPGIHDPALFVNRAELRAAATRGGVPLTLRGLRPSLSGMLWWLARREPEVRMVPTWSTAVLFQAYGDKADGARADGGRAGAEGGDEPGDRAGGKAGEHAARSDAAGRTGTTHDGRPGTRAGG
jgi:2-polyprenyl-6-hydroxyphenyl methylase/3-demethylubiquinone-9 3-methyltransferase